MTKLTGDILRLNTLDTIYTAAGATVLVRQGGATIATGTVDHNEHFEIELPAGLLGDIDIQLGLPNCAPVTATVDSDEDLLVAIFYNNQPQLA